MIDFHILYLNMIAIQEVLFNFPGMRSSIKNKVKGAVCRIDRLADVGLN